jgi:metacaspase-1
MIVPVSKCRVNNQAKIIKRRKTMATKKALCVGINDYPGGGDLRGCVNDANAWANLLQDKFGFTEVKTLIDAQATKQNILDELNNLIAGTQAGDALVFTNSSHGTYVADNNGDETYDEAVCAFDFNILDDELRQIFDAIPDGVRLTAILDNCHSGTGTRNPMDKKRFMSPEARGGRTIDLTTATPKSPTVPQSLMKEVLLTGCKDTEVSWDVKIGDTFHGAMTYCAIQAIEEAEYQLTYEQLHRRLGEILIEEEYDQTPQLEGKAANKSRQIFS